MGAVLQCSGLVAEDNISWHRQLQRKINKMMKHFLVAPAFLVLVCGTPLPQDPNDEVEVISGPVSTDEGDYDYNGFGGFGGFVPRVRVFVIPVQESDYDYADSSAGQGDVDDVRDRENELDFVEGEDGFGINNSTHTKKVLEDGTILHINKTTIADTDDDGNSFFFHRSVIHNVGGGEEGEETEEEEFETEVEAEDLDTGIDDGLI